MKKYNIIYADPPWKYDDKALNKGGSERHYDTMTIDKICGLPIAEIAADDCVLLMWATLPLIFEAETVIKSWGFKYKTCAFAWVKINKRTNVKQTNFLPHDSFDSFLGFKPALDAQRP